MKQQNYETGKTGEELAGEFLEKKGYKIIERNFRTRFGEIDLIVSDKDSLVFVEVKTKVGEDFGTPEEMINLNKIEKVQRMAEIYTVKNSGISEQFSGLRIDAVCLVLNMSMSLSRIDHYENIGF
ncbi:MAG: YraN family protein [Patescibacteria group bacterium]